MEILGRTKDGAAVENRPNSHLHDDILSVLDEALSSVCTDGRSFIEEEVDFGHVIGRTSCVSTGSKDCIVFAQRPNRKGLTRFVLDREKEPTTKAMIVLKQTQNPSVYVLITAFIGCRAELEPWDSQFLCQASKWEIDERCEMCGEATFHCNCKTRKEIAMNEEFPYRLYATPDTWGGEEFILDEEQADETADRMTECFGEDCDINECLVLWFVKMVDADTALYESRTRGFNSINEHLIRREDETFIKCTD